LTRVLFVTHDNLGGARPLHPRRAAAAAAAMEYFARSRSVAELGACAFDVDVTSIVRAATAALPATGMLCVPDFTVDTAMNAIELLDPKLDSRSHVRELVPLHARIADGSLPLGGATSAQALAAMDKLLQLEQSWLQGQSLPQSVFTSAYAHPVALQSMRALTGQQPYAPSVGPDFRFNEHPEVVATLAPRPARAVESALAPAQSALQPGSAPFARVSSLLAFTTAGLKSLDSAHRALFAADCAREEDFTSLTFGADCAWCVPAGEAQAMLAAAEAAVWAALPSHEHAAPALARLDAALQPLAAAFRGSWGGAVDPAALPELALTAAGWLRAALEPWCPPAAAAAAATAPPSVGGAGALPTTALTADEAAGLLCRLRFRRVHLAVHALLSFHARLTPPWRRTAAPTARAHGACYDLASVALAARAASALLGVIEATSPLFGGGEPAPETPFAAAPRTGELEHGANPHYAKLLISGHFRVVSHPPLRAVVGLWRRHWAHVHALTQLPAQASHNPHRPYWPVDVRHGVGASGGPDEPDVAGLPRINHGGYAPATVPLKALAAAAEALSGRVPGGTAVPGTPGGFAPGADPGAMADIPASGIVDPPPDWPAALAASSGAAQPRAPPRQHVSLHALLLALEQFSRRSPDALARSWTLLVLLEQAQAHPPAPSEDEQQQQQQQVGSDVEGATQAMSAASLGAVGGGGGAATEGGCQPAAGAPATSCLPVPFLDEYADWRGLHHSSAVVLGTHTLWELAQGALVDAGAHPDLLASVEGRRFVALLERVLAQTLTLLCRSRLRLRRQMDTQLRDWAFVLGECGYLDDVYKSYVAARCAAADAAYIAAGGQHATRTARSGGAAPQHATLEEHRQLAAMRLASPVQAALAQWATGVVRWLQRLHTVIGAESAVFHDDERIALYWHVECMVTALRRGVDRCDGVLALLAALPEPTRRLSAAARAALLATPGGGDLVLHELLPPPPPPPPEGAAPGGQPGEPAAPAAAPVAAAATRGGGGGGGGGDDDDVPRLKPAAPPAKGGGKGRSSSAGGAAGKAAAGAASAKQQEAAQARLLALLDAWLAPARTQLASFFGGSSAASSPSPRLPNRAGVLLDAHAQLCSALLRLLQGAVQLGLLRGLHVHVPPPLRDAVRRHPPSESIRALPCASTLLYAPPHADASVRDPPPSIRCDGRTYDTRWRDVGLVPDAPLPQWHKYVDAMCNTALSRSGAVGWLAEAGGLLRGVQAALAQVLAQAKAALAADGAALGWVAASPAAGSSSGGSGGSGGSGSGGSGGGGKKKGGKKGGGATTATDPLDDDGLTAAALASSASPAPLLPCCTTSWGVLHAGWDAAEAQRLGRVAVANVLALSALGKDVEEVLQELPPQPPPAGAPAPAPATAAPVVNMLDSSVLAWRQRWADAGASLQLGTQYDATYVAVRLQAAARPRGARA
jgi:hypothetical protein